MEKPIYGTKTVEEYKIMYFLNKNFIDFTAEAKGNEVIFIDVFGTITVMRIDNNNVIANGCNLGKWNA